MKNARNMRNYYIIHINISVSSGFAEERVIHEQPLTQNLGRILSWYSSVMLISIPGTSQVMWR